MVNMSSALRDIEAAIDVLLDSQLQLRDAKGTLLVAPNLWDEQKEKITMVSNNMGNILLKSNNAQNLLAEAEANGNSWGWMALRPNGQAIRDAQIKLDTVKVKCKCVQDTIEKAKKKQPSRNSEESKGAEAILQTGQAVIGDAITELREAQNIVQTVHTGKQILVSIAPGIALATLGLLTFILIRRNQSIFEQHQSPPLDGLAFIFFAVALCLSFGLAVYLAENILPGRDGSQEQAIWFGRLLLLAFVGFTLSYGIVDELGYHFPTLDSLGLAISIVLIGIAPLLTFSALCRHKV